MISGRSAPREESSARNGHSPRTQRSSLLAELVGYGALLGGALLAGPAGCGSDVGSPKTAATSTGASSGGGAASCDPSVHGVRPGSPLTLDLTTLTRGQVLTGKITYANPGCEAAAAQKIVITARRPGATHASGPFDDFAPAPSHAFPPASSFDLAASRIIAADDPPGDWIAFATYQDEVGVWHDGPDVKFTVTDASSGLSLCVNGSADALPEDAYELPVGEAAGLQSALDAHHRVRLEPGNSYRVLPSIILRADQQLYGLMNDIPSVVVEPGTHHAVLQGVNPDGLEFTASTSVTHHNCFQRLRMQGAALSVTGALVESNIFVDLSEVNLQVDTSKGGHMSANRFIRWLSHGKPAASFLGDAGRTSQGNVFLWSNMLTPEGGGFHADNQADLTFVGTDIESWNWGGGSPDYALTFGAMGTLRMVRPTGGASVPNKTGYLDVAADEVQLSGLQLFTSLPDPNVRLRSSVQRVLNVRSAPQSLQDEGSGLRIEAFADNAPKVTSSGVDTATSPLSAAEQSTLVAMIAPTRTGAPWERPLFRPIPDPTGPAWKEGLAAKPDSTAYLQGLIDKNGIARLPAGIYYISAPLQVGSGEGLIGAGAEKTAIVARDASIDIIVGREHLAATYSLTSFVLADVTLQGGNNGIHHEKNGSGGGAQYSLTTLSHVTMRDMVNAAIFIDGIMAWDNTFTDELNVVGCGAALKQAMMPSMKIAAFTMSRIVT